MSNASCVSGTFKHPMRLAIVRTVLAANRLSPSDVAAHLDEPLGNVSYHVRELAAAGILKPAGTKPVRGAVQHFYRVDAAALSREVNDLAAFVARLAVLAQDAAPEGVPA